MFSHRSAFERAPNALALAVESARARRARIVDLTESNPTAAGFAAPPALLAALSHPRGARYEPHPLGHPEARFAVAEELVAGGVTASADRIALVCSTSEAYSLAFRLLCDPGDRVLVPRPGYPLLEHLARADGVELCPYRLAYDGSWHIDLADLRGRAREPRARAVVCVNPNNPTGSFASRDEVRALAELGLPIVSDEVFAAYAFARETPPAPSLLDAANGGGPRAPLVLALGGLSKYAALPQLKLAWMIADGREAPEALARLEILADAYLSVATPVQLALPLIFALARETRAAIAARLARNLAEAARAVEGTAATLLRAQGGWYAVLRLPATRSDDEWALGLLAEHSVLVQPGWLYDFEGGPFAVISLLVPEPAFAEGVAAIATFVD
ncbi:MAG TPA: pyridoxal phosphate-dependent aminotransferase [Myxococcota bacterium]|nr:pyridoxal phosphate-dependent aminotransferase [Myxococcota bacterium]